MLERLGIVEERAAQRDAVLANCRVSSEARARILGKARWQPVAKEHRIVVDLKADTRTVETTDHVEQMTPRPRAPEQKPVTVPLVQKTKSLKRDHIVIINAVAEAFSVSLYGITSSGNARKFAYPRFAAAVLLREILGFSFQEIGRALGRRDHTTAMSAVKRGAYLLFTNPEWAKCYYAAKRALEAK